MQFTPKQIEVLQTLVAGALSGTITVADLMDDRAFAEAQALGRELIAINAILAGGPLRVP